MNRQILKFTGYALLLAWFSFFAWVGVSFPSEVPFQQQKDKAFIAEHITPKIATIDSFQTVNHRLPSVQEFNNINKGNIERLGDGEYIRSQQDAVDELQVHTKGVDWKNNYALQIWRGEWWEFYISEHQQYLTNNYSTADGVQELLMCIIVGSLPTLIWLVVRWRKKKAAASILNIN